MFVYIISVVIAVLLATTYQMTKTSKPIGVISRAVSRLSPIFLGLSFLTLFLLSGFRVDVGIDYAPYTKWFDDIQSSDFSYFEPGFRFMIDAIQWFTTDAQWLFIVSSFITLGFIFLAIKKYSVNPAMSVFLFCTMGFLSHSFNLTRQFIAVAITLYALNFILKRKLFKYLLVIGAAALFHKTALLMIPLYFIIKTKLTPAQYLITTIAVAAVSLMGSIIVGFLVTHFYPQYYDKAFVGESIISFYYILVSIGTLALVMHLVTTGKMSLKNYKDRVYVNIVFLIALAHTFLVWVPLSNRISLYLDIMLIIIIPALISKIPLHLHRNIISIVVFVYFSIAFYLSLASNANGVLPYNSTLLSYSVEQSSRQGWVC
jgi:transmembrane protein EpsG